MTFARVLALAAIAGGLMLPPASRAAPDNTLGMALLGAYVRTDSSLHGSSGVTAVSKTGGGDYSITFDRDVSSCILSGTVAQASQVMLTAYVLTGVDPAKVRVVTFYYTGSVVDVPFYVMAFCPQ